MLAFGCDSSTLQVGSLTGFAAGDKVLLLQMQVPRVDLSNTVNFGTLLQTTCIGNYEFNRIQSLGGSTIQLQFALTHPGAVSGRVQLVRVPEYDSATACDLTCLPWNGSVGGVLVLDVKSQLILSDHLDVSGQGFRGGNYTVNLRDAAGCLQCGNDIVGVAPPPDLVLDSLDDVYSLYRPGRVVIVCPLLT